MTMPSHRGVSRIPIPPLMRIARFMKDPLGTQEDLLRRLLTRARSTEWGLRLDFAGALKGRDVITSFQQRVRLSEYEDLRQDVERMRLGEQNITWPGGIRHFAVSSGTTAAGKIIPLSHEMLVSNRSFSVGAVLNYVIGTRRMALLRGRHLTLPGRIEEDPQHPGTLIGEVSGLQAEYAPVYFRHFYQAIPNEMAFLPNWESKLDAIVERTLGMDVRMLVMAPTWALVFFKLLVQRRNERGEGRVETVGEIWPNLRLFISGGVALSSYRELLTAQIALPRLDFLETYGASEGFFSFQTDLDDPAMLLHLNNGVFYEFVRADEVHADDPPRYTLRDVQPGIRYAMYVSSCSGLWSYGVKDLVRFSSVNPYKLEVAGRTSEMLDKYGEAMYGDEARAALQEACTRMNVQVLDFHVAPRPADLARLPTHQWIVEFETPPQDLAGFVRIIDAYLQEVNRHYQIRREARAFDLPEIVPVPVGTFYRWLRTSRDRISGQTKVPRMREDREVADAVLAAAGEAT